MVGKMRYATILSSESDTTDGTKVISLQESNPISQIVIRQKLTNNGSTPTGHSAASLVGITVRDGSDILYNLSGFGAQALNFYEEGALPFNVLEYENNIQQTAVTHINFGRFVGDKNLALDPARFKNLSLEVEHDVSIAGSTADAGTLYVGAQVFEPGAASPQGFLQSRVHQAYTLSASAHEYIDLPTDLTLRRIMLQSRNTTQSATDQSGNIKLQANNGEQVIIPATDVSEWLKLQTPSRMVQEKFAGLGTGSSVSYFITPTYEAETVGVGRSATQTVEIFAQPAGGTAAVSNDASEGFSGFVMGYAPHGGIDLPFGDQQDINDWLDPRGLKSLSLDVTAGGSASGTNNVITQQLRRY